MDELENLDSYNRTPEHDSWVDYDYHENTSELSDLFDDTNMDVFINNLNDWD